MLTRSARAPLHAASAAAPQRRCRLGSRPCCSASSASASDASTAPRCVLTTLSPVTPTLGVSVYPDFLYDAGGDSVAARCGPLGDDGRRKLVFDTAPVTPVNGGSTTILGIPLPPFVEISITPHALSGWFEPSSGRMELDFDASFTATIFGRAFPPLSVVAPLRTGASVGAQRAGGGAPWDARSGECVLTAVARVPRTGDMLLDTFLLLPADALAVLPARVEWLSEEQLQARAGEVGTRPPNTARAQAAARAWAGGAAAAAAAALTVAALAQQGAT